MKNVVDGFFTAFSLYSAIPAPKTEWNARAMRYALCFFPLIGVIIGVLQLSWLWICQRFNLTAALYAAVAALLPLAVTGGIHMDGFMDTCDAVSSHGLMEKKLEILKDPHTGAFGVLFCAAYLLLCFGLWQQLYANPKFIALVFIGYAVSRAFNAISIATFPCAKTSGLARAFSDAASKRAVLAVCVPLAVAALFLGVLLSPVWGGAAALCAAVYFPLHRRFCVWEFGGNTGDLAGFLLQNLEMIFLGLAAIGAAI